MGVPAFEQPLVFQESVRDIGVFEVGSHVRLPEVTVSPAGHEVVLKWAAAAGATEVEIARATVEIGPFARAASGTLTATSKGAVFELNVPAHRRVRSIGLDSLRWIRVIDGEVVKTPLRSSADLGAGVRITVAAPDANNQMVTRYAVPAVGRRNGVPGQFGGASLANGVISVPEMADRRIQIGLVNHAAPQDWAQELMELGGTVTASMVTVPADVSLRGPDGAELWAFPGEYADVPPAAVGIEPQLRAAFLAALQAGAPLEARLTLKAANQAPIGLRVTGPTGALVRRFAAVPALVLEGDPVAPELVEPGTPPLAGEMPASVTADVTITYAGIRLLDTIADALPAPAAVRGHIVRAEPRLRALPPDALRDVDIARIGLIGRAPEPCELSVQLVDVRGGAALGPPGVVRLEPQPDIRTVWVEMPAAAVDTAHAGIRVRTTHGRFFWCAAEQPLVRVAVHDPDPAGRPVRLGGTAVHAMTGATAQLRGVTLPPSAFRSHAAAFDSRLFVTVEMADLLLRYAR